MVLLLLVKVSFWRRLTNLHLSMLIMTVLRFRDIFKFFSVNTAVAILFVWSEYSF